jgi:transposase
MEEDIQHKLTEWGAESFNWSAYNNSQMREKIMFLDLLGDICKLLDDDALAHKIFCIGVKTYANTSSRRVISELELCKRKGWIQYTPHFNSILNYLNDLKVKRALKYLLELSALPLAQLEKQFCIDSTGFSERKYIERWSVIRQDFSRHQSYKKAHCIYGAYSNAVVSCIVTEGSAADSPKFIELLDNAARNFKVQEVSADMGYLSRENMMHAESLDITPFILFKKNSTGNSRGAMIWNKMYKYFKNNPEEFMKHYHQRSNCESGFFMIKQRFGDYVYTKNELSQTNEILAKILCHNLIILIQEIFLSKLEFDFSACAKTYVAQPDDN